MISYCGLDCSQCPAYLATQSGDREALEKVAADWSEQFKMEVPVEGVICDGCKSETGQLSGYCGICEVRACAVGKGVVTCAHCEDYDCETLRGCPGYRAIGKKTLDRIKEESR